MNGIRTEHWIIAIVGGLVLLVGGMMIGAANERRTLSGVDQPASAVVSVIYRCDAMVRGVLQPSTDRTECDRASSRNRSLELTVKGSNGSLSTVSAPYGSSVKVGDRWPQ